MINDILIIPTSFFFSFYFVVVIRWHSANSDKWISIVLHRYFQCFIHITRLDLRFVFFLSCEAMILPWSSHKIITYILFYSSIGRWLNVEVHDMTSFSCTFLPTHFIDLFKSTSVVLFFFILQCKKWASNVWKVKLSSSAQNWWFWWEFLLLVWENFLVLFANYRQSSSTIANKAPSLSYLLDQQFQIPLLFRRLRQNSYFLNFCKIDIVYE